MGVSEVKQSDKITSYKDLRVWQLGMDIATSIYKLTSTFPDIHKYALSQQMQKCAVSVPSNIAEGYSRDGTGEYLYFLSVAQGSRSELETQLEIAINIGLTDKNENLKLIEDLEILGRTLKKLSLALKQKSQNPISQIQNPKNGVK